MKKDVIFTLILIVLLLIAFPIGYSSYTCINQNTMLPLKEVNSVDLFFYVFFNNVGFSVLILLGIISINITTAGILFYTGYTWGIQVAVLKCKYGKNFLLDSLIYHFSIELLWITILVYTSCKLSINFYDTFNNKKSLSTLILEIKSQKRILVFALLLIFLGAIIEVLVPKILLTN